MNEIIAAAKSGRGKRSAFARMKATWTGIVAAHARSAHMDPMESPVNVTFSWEESSARRDPDNIHAGAKFVLDGLVEAGILVGDGQRHIAMITHEPNTVGDEPGVWVVLKEAVR